MELLQRKAFIMIRKIIEVMFRFRVLQSFIWIQYIVVTWHERHGSWNHHRCWIALAEMQQERQARLHMKLSCLSEHVRR